jgi:hypothetical protein
LATDARKSVHELLRLGWLIRRDVFGATVTLQHPKLRKLIAERLAQPNVEEKLSELRVDIATYVKIVGSMSEYHVFHSYLQIMQSARDEICLPMMVTAPASETVEVLRSRAKAGVRIKILLADPALAAKFRAGNVQAIAIERLLQWRQLFHDCPTVAIRLCRFPEDMELATCFSVDGKLARFDIYDPYGQQSLEGVMLEVGSPRGLTPNFVRIFIRLFDDAWSRSVGVGPLARTIQFVLRSWKLWFAAVALVLAFLPIPLPHWSEILIGVSCGIAAPLILEEGPKVGRLIRRRRA